MPSYGQPQSISENVVHALSFVGTRQLSPNSRSVLMLERQSHQADLGRTELVKTNAGHVKPTPATTESSLGLPLRTQNR